MNSNNPIPKLLLFLLPFVLSTFACAQDCMGTSFVVKGYILDAGGRPISNATVKAWNDGSFEKPAFSLIAVTDANGYFQTDSVFSYGCTPFEVEVAAEGYKAISVEYYPPAGEGWPDELPDEIQITLQSR
jgi:hypothetical protein